jgi:hypothetical protein
MTWERFFDALLPFIGVIIGVASTRLGDERREKHERERIVVNRAIDIEGEALIELQDRLVELPAVWIEPSWMIYTSNEERGVGGTDPEDAYAVVTRAAEPMHRARVLVG